MLRRIFLLFPRIRNQASLFRLPVNNKTPAFAEVFMRCGEGGIRTPGTLIEYASLANWWIKPLSHLSSADLSRTKVNK